MSDDSASGECRDSASSLNGSTMGDICNTTCRNKPTAETQIQIEGQGSNAGAVTSTTDNSTTTKREVSKQSTSTKQRCAICRKKTGLTGFSCRCGGLYCALHRYSDTHNCSFNYRQLGEQEIRRNNPLVVGEKIKKI